MSFVVLCMVVYVGQFLSHEKIVMFKLQPRQETNSKHDFFIPLLYLLLNLLFSK